MGIRSVLCQTQAEYCRGDLFYIGAFAFILSVLAIYFDAGTFDSSMSAFGGAGTITGAVFSFRRRVASETNRSSQ